MRGVVVAVLLAAVTMASAATPERIFNFYQAGDFRNACLEGAQILREYRNDDIFVNAYGIACLKSDFIDLAAPSVMHLRATRASRQNAAYILTVVLQKKLLYHAIADDIDISGTLLPNTPHILSKVYSAYIKERYERQGNGYEMQIDGERVSLDSLFEGGHFKIRIRRYEGDQLIAQHLYW